MKLHKKLHSRISRKLKKALKYGIERRIKPFHTILEAKGSDTVFKYKEYVEFKILGKITKYKLIAQRKCIKEYNNSLYETLRSYSRTIY